MTQVLAPPDQPTARQPEPARQPPSPLRNPRFDALLLAAVTTNVGIVMQGVATTWLLLSVTSSAILIALHQTAAVAPMFLLILVTGALADVVDRRLLLVLPLLLMVAVALAFPSLRKKIGADVAVIGATVISAVGLVGLATAPSFPVFALALFLLGAAQSMVTTGIISAAQAALPTWVRGRGLSIYMLHFFAATAIGSVIWGLIANGLQVSVALFVAAGAMLGTLLLAPAYRLAAAEALDPMAVNMGAFGFVRTGGGGGEPDFNDGPVGVLVTYTVDDANSEAFVRAMAEVARQRRRDGAMQWRLYRDIDAPGRYVEWFTVATWAEHLRQVERPTASDLKSWASVQRLYRDTRVQHFVAANAASTTRIIPPG